MRNKDYFMVLLIVILALFLWQFIQKLSKAVETAGGNTAPDLSAKLAGIDQTVTALAYGRNQNTGTAIDYYESYEAAKL